MLQSLSERVRLCHRQAEKCARRAEAVSDASLRTVWLRREESWLKLACSYDFEQRLALVVNEGVRRINERNRNAGHIRADNAQGATAAWVQSPVSTRAAPDPKYLQNELIAIIDDEACVRGGLSNLIESRGHRAETFASAEDYLACEAKENAACLILDVHLPGMSGPDLQGRLIAEGRCPPTVFVTGRFEEQVQRRVIEAGALGYLTKPCDEQALFDCIESALGAIR
jgi:CheY-like chemotaxis protein